MVRNNLVVLECVSDAFGVSIGTIASSGQQFIVVEGVRPSYHLVMAREPSALTEFKRTMEALEVLNRHPFFSSESYDGLSKASDLGVNEGIMTGAKTTQAF